MEVNTLEINQLKQGRYGLFSDGTLLALTTYREPSKKLPFSSFLTGTGACDLVGFKEKYKDCTIVPIDHIIYYETY